MSYTNFVIISFGHVITNNIFRDFITLNYIKKFGQVSVNYCLKIKHYII